MHVSDRTLAVELPEAESLVVRRTTTQPVRTIKGQRPRAGRTLPASAEPAASES